MAVQLSMFNHKLLEVNLEVCMPPTNTLGGVCVCVCVYVSVNMYMELFVCV